MEKRGSPPANGSTEIHEMRNLTPLRPPARQNGRLQRQARRVLWLMHEATTGQVMEWSYCLKVHRGERIARWDYRSTRRALESI